MDTTKLKRFAVEARIALMTGVKHRLKALGFDLATGEVAEMPQKMEGGAVFMNDVVSTDFYRRWMSLYNNVRSRSIREVAEEAAYTWFNRFMAIRIMAKQGFITPVLEYESPEVRIPLIVSEAREGRMPEMPEAQRTQLMDLLNDDSKTAEQFRILIVAYCHDNPIINKCFGTIADYTELLLPHNVVSDGGFVDMINHTDFISEEQYASAELIGWLYQFYISDRKDEAFAKKGKYDADEIAPATQIFTPNWIVKYMAENTLGRIYIDNNPYCELKDDLKYLVDVKPSAEPMKVDDVCDLKVADLACGSGHILNECFDMLYKIYVEEGYSRREAIEGILRKNLLGIDLDTRAKQLATFALLMKACQKDSSFLDGRVMPRVYNMPRPIAEVIPADWYESVQEEPDAKTFLKGTIPHYMLGCNDEMTKELTDAILLMNHADTLGSIMKFDISESTRNAVMVRTQEYEEQLANGEFVPEANQLYIPYMNIILALTEKYSAICMNPPYMGSGRFDAVLSKYVKDNYPRSKADLFSVFMDVAIDRLAAGGKYGMINMHSWMFLSSFEDLRRDLLDNYSIDSLLHLGPRTFDELSGEVVQNAAFVVSLPLDGKKLPLDGRNLPSEGNSLQTECKSLQQECKNTGTYFRLVDGRNCSDKECMYLEALNKHTEKVYYARVNQHSFLQAPGASVGSYWFSPKMFEIMSECVDLNEAGYLSGGRNKTHNNDKYVRYNWEVSRSNFIWKPYSDGGECRKWYGNEWAIVNWSEEAKANYQSHGGLLNSKFWNKTGITWNSGKTGFRIKQGKDIYSSCSPTIFNSEIDLDLYLLGLLNTKVSKEIIKTINPTITLNPGDVLSLKLKETSSKGQIINKVEETISISRLDWDAHETSWDFECNHLVQLSWTYRDDNGKKVFMPASLETLYDIHKKIWTDMFMQLHANEEELNRQFIDIYGLQDELTPDVPLNEITILQQGEISIENPSTGSGQARIVWHADVVMKQLISYAVGCMMGRYSLDKPGLILANQGDGLKEYEALVPNSRFEVDDDGIVPLMASDTDFADNATLRFKQWLTVAFGEENLVANLNFIESALGKSLDDYFVKDFWKDHKKMYQNRPIYWQFASKKGAFQCIAYMHRMNPYTAERIRTKYLLPHIEWLLNKQKEMEANAAALSTRERKQLDNLTKQIAECREYHDRLHVIADQQINFDLDDGVIVNHAKFSDVVTKLK